MRPASGIQRAPSIPHMRTNGARIDTLLAGLARRRVAHLATADADGAPSVVPICFAVLDRTLYSVVDRKPKRSAPSELRRMRNIRANARAAVVADHYDEDWSKLGWVLARGRARLIESGDEHARAVAALRTKYAQYREMRLDDRPVIAIAVEHVTAWGSLG